MPGDFAGDRRLIEQVDCTLADSWGSLDEHRF